MANKTRIQTIVYLAPDKVDALNQLAARTRILKSVLLREAVDDLLEKYSRLGSRFWYDSAADGPMQLVSKKNKRTGEITYFGKHVPKKKAAKKRAS